MDNYGFVRVAAATPKVKVADCDYNTHEIIEMINSADKQDVAVIVFPELCITSYTAQDLFFQSALLDSAKASLNAICMATKTCNIISIVGLPLEVGNKLYNIAAVLYQGKVCGIVPKTFIPNYNEFYEKRWFASPNELKQNSITLDGYQIPIGTDIIFETSDFRFGIEICEDLWAPVPPSSLLSLYGADLIFNLSASNEIIGKHDYRISLIKQQSARCISGYIYTSAGMGESTTDLVFSGSSIISETGYILASSELFSLDNEMTVSEIDIEKIRNERLKNQSFSRSELKYTEEYSTRIIEIETGSEIDKKFKLKRHISPTPFIPSVETMNEKCSEIFAIQLNSLVKRLMHTNINNAVVGISGGLDSTLALLVIVKAFDKLKIPRKNIHGITMPGFGTTDRTYSNALALMQSLDISVKEISIRKAVTQHFEDIGHDINTHDVTYENSQARERTQILMDYSNMVNGLVIGTGDLSELALGWCTYNGDHMSMYAVNAGIPKTLVQTLVKWVSDTQIEIGSKHILADIVDTPISPELLPRSEDGLIAQKTEDTVGPYILHDFFLYYMLRFGFTPRKIYFLAQNAFAGEYTDEILVKWLKVFYKRFFSQQFKRSCMPDGAKVGSVNLSPRGDWRMPSDASSAIWLKDLDALQ